MKGWKNENIWKEEGSWMGMIVDGGLYVCVGLKIGYVLVLLVGVGVLVG